MRNLTFCSDFLLQNDELIQWFAAKFPMQKNRELFRPSREFQRENREFEPGIVQIDFRMTVSEATGFDVVAHRRAGYGETAQRPLFRVLATDAASM